MERRSSLTRRTALAGATLLLALGLVACSGKGPVGPAPVATIEGREITRDEVTEISEALAAFVELSASSQGAAVDEDQLDAALLRYRGVNDETTGSAGAAEALSALVQIEVLTSLLDDAGGEITDADRATASDQIQQQLSQRGIEATAAIQPIIDAETELGALSAALQRALIDPAEREAQLREVYEANREEFASVCIQQLVTVEQAEAEAAAERIEGGEDFVDVATELSIQPEIAASGDEGTCIARTQLAGVFPEEAETATTGDVIGPADAQGAWLLVRIWDEREGTFEDARAQLEEQVPNEGQEAAAARVSEAYASADIEIDPRYGTWDAEQGTVLPPADPLAATTSTQPPAP